MIADRELKKTKVRLKITYITEYEITPEYYDGMTDPEQMLQADIDFAETDPFGLMSGDGELKVEGEIIA